MILLKLTEQEHTDIMDALKDKLFKRLTQAALAGSRMKNKRFPNAEKLRGQYKADAERIKELKMKIEKA